MKGLALLAVTLTAGGSVPLTRQVPARVSAACSPNGGHVAAFAHIGGYVYFASVHGYAHQETTIRILAAMLPS